MPIPAFGWYRGARVEVELKHPDLSTYRVFLAVHNTGSFEKNWTVEAEKGEGSQPKAGTGAEVSGDVAGSDSTYFKLGHLVFVDKSGIIEIHDSMAGHKYVARAQESVEVEYGPVYFPLAKELPDLK
jgi:hypothetical protein